MLDQDYEAAEIAKYSDKQDGTTGDGNSNKFRDPQAQSRDEHRQKGSTGTLAVSFGSLWDSYTSFGAARAKGAVPQQSLSSLVTASLRIQRDVTHTVGNLHNAVSFGFRVAINILFYTVGNL